MTGLHLPPSVRFWNKVNKTDSCWLWTAVLDQAGYGQFRVSGRTVRAHRYSWELSNGRPIPNGLHACHRCDVRQCVNPDHLFLGTDQDNVDDRGDKGRTVTMRGEHHGNASLNWDKVREIRLLSKLTILGTKDIASLYGVQPSAVSKIICNRTWKPQYAPAEVDV
jgi:hypothetical protein